MSRKFDELKKMLMSVDKKQVGNLVKDFKRAREDGKIDERERKELMDSAKRLLKDTTSNRSDYRR